MTTATPDVAHSGLSRRGLLAAVGGFALSTSGLLVPERLVEEAAAAEKPTRRIQDHTEQRNRKRRNEHKRNQATQKQDDTPPGRGLLKDLVLIGVRNDTAERRPLTVVADRTNVPLEVPARGHLEDDIPFGDDRGWLFFPSGELWEGKPKGSAILINNPAVGTVWVEMYNSVFLWGNSVIPLQTTRYRDPLREGETIGAAFVMGHLDLKRLTDTSTKNFEVTFVQ